MQVLVLALLAGAVNWQHPAGLVTRESLAEMGTKLEGQEWARNTFEDEKRSVDPWLTVSLDDLRRVFPTTCGNVYHLFSCSVDRSRLTFDPFQDDDYVCPSCGAVYARDTDPGVYEPDSRYHGTMYDGWKCLFYQKACGIAASMAVIGRLESSAPHIRRAIDLLMLFADTISGIETIGSPEPAMARILTYHREGDTKVLNELARAYELLRDDMSDAQRERFERDVLRRMLDDTHLEPIYTYDWNNVYQWHRAIVQCALALEREDLIDWSFGYGAFDPDLQPEHRSVRRLAASHFKPDGAFWEMCSGYHLYPLYFFCELAVLSRNLSRMDPERFPPERYDLTDPRNPDGAAIKRALEWFVSMAMPDRTMTTVGDSMEPRGSLAGYYATAEVGYRYFDVRAIGDYEALRSGKRTWDGFLYGAPEIVQHPTPFTSSYLSSGWVSLRSAACGDRMWAGLNALIPGGGHQHADRLTLTTYAQGNLLALEKSTPYNESVTRVLGTLSQAHNTVTVDMTSQPQGESLTGEQIPHVALFFAPKLAQFVEARADRIYPNTTVYRRALAMIDGMLVDFFRVEGGSTHDWIVNHAGEAPALSVAAEPATFEPADWLYNGTDQVFRAVTAAAWDVRWSVGGATSRLTMMPAADTQVFRLETYPVKNAFITPDNPPCQTLCARRTSGDPFLAVWDAWTDQPHLETVTPGSRTGSLCLKTGSHTWYLLFGPGETRFEDGTALETDAEFAMIRDRDAFMAVAGRFVSLTVEGGKLRASWSERASVAAEYTLAEGAESGAVALEIAPDIHYDTIAGQDVPRPAPEIALRYEGDLWRVPKAGE